MNRNEQEWIVVAGILPAVEDGILAARTDRNKAEGDRGFLQSFGSAYGFFRWAGKPGSTAGKDACCYGLLLFLALVCFTTTALAQRERTLFNEGWRFAKGDPDGVADSLSYTNLKAWILPSGNAFRATNTFTSPTEESPTASFAQPDFNDSSWRKLNLPHDWGIEGPFKQEYQGETGKLPWWGVAWYRKQFTSPASDAGRRIVLEVDGAMSYASVWLNGKLVGGWPYGYASWQVDLTPFVKVGGENVIAIRLDNPKDRKSVV